MDKGKALELEALPTSFLNLDLNFNSKNPNNSATHFNPTIQFQSSLLTLKKPKPPSLVSLCLGLLGKHFEDILDDLGEIASNFPSNIKVAMAAIARRRKLLNDDLVVALAESSWELLDISDSDVSDIGLSKVAEICKHVRAVDISRCSKITSLGVSALVKRCHSLEILRWGL